MTTQDDEPYDTWVQSVFHFLLNDAKYPHQIGERPNDIYFGSLKAAAMQIETWRTWYEDEKSVSEIKEKLDLSYRAVSSRILKIRNYLAHIATGAHDFDAIRETVNILVNEYDYNIKDAMRAMFISSMTRTRTNQRGAFIRKSDMQVEEMFDLVENHGLSLAQVGVKAGINKSTVSRMLARFRKDTHMT